MKGALVEFAETFGASTPNVIVFQFNPETLRHTFSQPQSASSGSNPLAVQGMPGDTFSFTMSMEVTDQIIDGNDAAQLDARMNGIYSRLSALEMLMFPVTAATPGGGDRDVPAFQLPTVLFVWGPGRIVPVRVTSLSITEKLFDSLLNPTHAEATIELRVVTTQELDSLTGPLKAIAQAAYHYTQHKRELLALVNINNAAGSLDLPPLPGI